ncbi:MAG: sugar phosphate nucleotidyltransferase [Bacteroidota bacterium]
MNRPTASLQIDVVILAGGLGSRLRPVLADRPKVLAPVGGTPFLAHLLDWLTRSNPARVVLCLGHLGSMVVDWLAAQPPRPFPVVPVIEPQPMGTAGALRFARSHLHSDPVLVLNGDTILDADIGALLALHRSAGPQATLLCAPVTDTSRYGSVVTDGEGRVVAFMEKSGASGPGLVSAGALLLSGTVLDAIAAGEQKSIEHDVLPHLGHIRTMVHTGKFLDFGTPESFSQAQASEFR